MMPYAKVFNKHGQQCSKCKQFLFYKDFYKSASKKSGYKSQCKECVRRKHRDMYDTPQGRKARQEKAWHDKGIDMTVERYEEILASQNGLCAICDATVNKNGTRLCVDHDHVTGQIRGLLCHNCNVSLGRFNDDVVLLQKAIDYLNFYRSDRTVV